MKKLVAMSIIGLMTTSSLIGCSSQPTNQNEDAQTNESAEDVQQSSMTPQLVVYQGATYLATANDSSVITEALIGDEIGQTTGFIDYMSHNLDESLLTQELANSISSDAVIYKMKNYSDDYRLLVKANDTYYICEKTAVVLDNNASAKEIAPLFDYEQMISAGSIYNNSLTTKYKDLTAAEVKQLLNIFEQATVANLTSSDYEDIASAQSLGKSYQVKVTFEDQTYSKLIVIPELNLVNMSEQYFTLDTLNDQVAPLFGDVLPQSDEIVN